MRLTFWGVRGSYPVASHQTTRYGGHTSCVELSVEGLAAPFVLDAGTGLRNLGIRLLEGPFGRGEGTLRLFLSHLHWDHVQGLPFFGPAHVGGNRIAVYGRGRDGAPLLDAVTGITRREFFPVGMEAFPATMEFTELTTGVPVEVDGVRVLPMALNHPWGSLGYRFDHGGKSVAYITDTSPFDAIRYPERFVT
jgi:phosphoribosyl 1,2-cyclic phosphodiesterase